VTWRRLQAPQASSEQLAGLLLRCLEHQQQQGQQRQQQGQQQQQRQRQL
jgi:hypothetical protein